MKSNLKYIITSACFLIFIFGFTIAGYLSEDKAFSETENRTLQQIPEFSWTSLKSGVYTSKLDTYMSDQIFLKDQLVSIKVRADRMLLKNYQNDIYFGDDNYFIQDYKESKALIDTNINAINNFCDKIKGEADISFMLVPNAISVLSDKLPAVTQCDNQLESIEYVKDKLSENINLYCPYDELKSASDNGTQVFFRTDHHWTPEGARVGFDGLMAQMGESVPDIDYTIETLNDFYGTLYSKAPYSGAKSDSINLYSNKDNEITVTYANGANDPSLITEGETVGNDIVTHSIFDDYYKTQKDKYATFLGGNFALVNIESTVGKDENVLILKDSYANSTIPYFVNTFKHITLIDMRYYHMQALEVSEYVKENNIDKVIFLYNMDFINSDNNFVWLG